MMMKFTWGTGILLTIIVFILAVIAFFIYSSNLDINLVEENYYEKELAYQERIDRTRNTESLGEKVRISLSRDVLRIDFPGFFQGKKTEGHVLFYRPSDPAGDFTIPLQLNDSAFQIIDPGRMASGRYILKIEWISNGTGYYYEEEVYRE